MAMDFHEMEANFTFMVLQHDRRRKKKKEKKREENKKRERQDRWTDRELVERGNKLGLH